MAALPSTMRQHCLQIATVGGSGSYSLLAGCIESQSKARESNKTTEFKY